MNDKPYASLVGNLMYALVCTRLDIAFPIRVQGYKDDLKSTSWYVFIFACAAVSWRSIKQPLTVASTMLAEFFASYEAISQAMWGTKGQMLPEKIRDGYTGSEHINTTDMTADPLTKGLWLSRDFAQLCFTRP
ncbi:unnamed protein product [Prunus armeniaca]